VTSTAWLAEPGAKLKTRSVECVPLGELMAEASRRQSKGLKLRALFLQA